VLVNSHLFENVLQNEVGWCCATQLFEPDVVTQVHKLYIDAGADIIITNAYATNRNVMESASDPASFS
jgi:methionine synthase I (cobalamin-dependent)